MRQVIQTRSPSLKPAVSGLVLSALPFSGAVSPAHSPPGMCGDFVGLAVQRGDLAGELAPEDVRELDRDARRARAVVDVDMVDADRPDAHQRLAGLRRGLGRFFMDEDLGTAELVEPGDLHTLSLVCRARMVSAILRFRYRPSFRSPWNFPSATITLPRSTVTEGHALTSLPSHGV